MKKINNQPNNADNFKTVTDKCNYNFEFLEKAIPNVEAILKTKGFITEKDLKTSFSMSDIKGLLEEIANLRHDNQLLNTKLSEFEKSLAEVTKISLDAVRVSLDTQKLISLK